MAIETRELLDEAPVRRRRGARILRRIERSVRRFLGHYRFNSITRRIIVLNFSGVTVLVAGILYLNEGRVKFTQTRVESLMTQAAIIASAIAQTSTSQLGAADDSQVPDSDTRTPAESSLNQDLSTLSFRINPEVVAPMLRDLVGPTKTRARIYDSDGNLLLDSQQLYTRGQIGRIEATPRQDQDRDPVTELWQNLKFQFYSSSLPVYRDMGRDGKAYEEVVVALAGSPLPLLRVTQAGETVISVAMPVQMHKIVLGALMLTTQGSDIDEIIAKERWQVVEVAGLVIGVTGFLSWLLAGTIAGPMRRLAVAAERVRKNIKNREQIPDFSHRPDEIGYLSGALREMTNALYLRLDAIESFAADVSHELKNPLTSLRSAAGMLTSVKREDDRQKLIDIIQHDVRRLDRLITDIADASRLDAELARETAKPVNMANLLTALCEITQDSRAGNKLNIVLRIEGGSDPASGGGSPRSYCVVGHDSRLSQVVTNLLDNAMSFSPENGTIFVSARRLRKANELEIAVEDEGPGIPEENVEKIFDRFYTDRPESFGQNSGLGLHISQQILRAHNGRIWVENRTSPEPVPLKPGNPGKGAKLEKKAVPTGRPPVGDHEAFACGVAKRCSYGARFVIRLPLAGAVPA